MKYRLFRDSPIWVFADFPAFMTHHLQLFTVPFLPPVHPESIPQITFNEVLSIPRVSLRGVLEIFGDGEPWLQVRELLVQLFLGDGDR